MSAGTPMRRRRFIQLAIGAGSAALMARLAPWRALVEVVESPLAVRLPGLLEHRSSATAVGREYLRAVPAERGTGSLVTAIVSRLGEQRTGAQVASRAELQAMVADGVRNDFDAGLTLRLQGWIVSRTEARICALAALRERPPDARSS